MRVEKGKVETAGRKEREEHKNRLHHWGTDGHDNCQMETSQVLPIRPRAFSGFKVSFTKQSASEDRPRLLAVSPYRWPLTSALLAVRLRHAHGQRAMIQILRRLALPVLRRPAGSAGAFLGFGLLWRAAGPWRDRRGHILSGVALWHRGIHRRSVARHQRQLVVLRQRRLRSEAEFHLLNPYFRGVSHSYLREHWYKTRSPVL